jgi:hypothetical protein
LFGIVIASCFNITRSEPILPPLPPQPVRDLFILGYLGYVSYVVMLLLCEQTDDDMSSGTRIGLVIGATIVGVLLCMGIVVLGVRWRRRRHGAFTYEDIDIAR